MSSDRRPWYKWFPKDFVCDEKVKSLSPLSELVYRRLLDTMWQSSACVLLNDCLRLANVAGSGLSPDEFKKAWEEIQTPGFELFKISEDDRFIYSTRMNKQLQEIDIRANAGKKGGKASAQAKSKQNPSKRQANVKDTDTDTDIDNNTPYIPQGGSVCPHHEIIKIYHDILPELAPVKVWNTQNQKNLSARWKEDEKYQSTEWWADFFKNEIRTRPFLMGRKTDFKANLGWIVGPKNFSKILNGMYQKEGDCDERLNFLRRNKQAGSGVHG